MNSVRFQTDLYEVSGSYKIKFLHFNDCYNIEEKKKKDYKGGAPRFVTTLRHFQAKAREEGAEVVTLFSGDLLSPSLISTLYEGEQMIGPFNRCRVDVACLGNHDLDFGINQMKNVTGQTSATWLISNLLEKDQDE